MRCFFVFSPVVVGVAGTPVCGIKSLPDNGVLPRRTQTHTQTHRWVTQHAVLTHPAGTHARTHARTHRIQHALSPTTRTGKKKTQLKPLGRPTLRRKLLGQGHELTDRFVSDSGRQLIEQNKELEDARGLLRAGNGVAFLTPKEVIPLPAWSSRLVPVRCFGDIPGAYRDEVVAELDEEAGLAPVRVAVRATLSGCPIALQASCAHGRRLGAKLACIHDAFRPPSSSVMMLMSSVSSFL